MDDRYEAAIERLKQWDREHEGKGYIVSERDAFIFPELTESEDERIRKAILKAVEDNILCYEFVDKKDMISWLENQKEQKPIKTAIEAWEEMRLEVYAQASGNKPRNESDDTSKIFSLNDIDYIFEKISNTIVEQKPTEWSEEDEKMRWDLIGAFTDKNNSHVDEFMQNRATKADVITWLKSLRPNHWKPSEEQMEYLSKAILYCIQDGNEKTACVLKELFGNLKKL